MNTQNDSSKLTHYKTLMRSKTSFFHQCWQKIEKILPNGSSAQGETAFFIAAFLRLQCIRFLYDRSMSKSIRVRILNAFDHAMGFFLLEWIETHISDYPERIDTMTTSRIQASSETIGRQVMGYIPLCRILSDRHAEARSFPSSSLPRLISEDRFLEPGWGHSFQWNEASELTETMLRYTSAHLPNYVHLLRSDAEQILSAFQEAFSQA